VLREIEAGRILDRNDRILPPRPFCRLKNYRLEELVHGYPFVGEEPIGSLRPAAVATSFRKARGGPTSQIDRQLPTPFIKALIAEFNRLEFSCHHQANVS
jgi:hypothetical protein